MTRNAAQNTRQSFRGSGRLQVSDCVLPLQSKLSQTICIHSPSHSTRTKRATPGGWGRSHCATSFVVLVGFNFLCDDTYKVLIATRSYTSSSLMKWCGVHPDLPSLQLELYCWVGSQASYLSVIACFLCGSKSNQAFI